MFNKIKLLFGVIDEKANPILYTFYNKLPGMSV